MNHGFLRSRHGGITKLNVPGEGKSAGQGTLAVGNNAEGAITGWFIDSNSVAHGFVWNP